MIPIGLDTVDAGPLRAAAPLRPPALVMPAPRQVSFGRVSGRVSPGTTRVVLEVNGTVRARKAPTRGRFRFHVDLPPRDSRLRVVAVDALGQRRGRTVRNVYGLPRGARPSRGGRTVEDAALAATVERLARGYEGTAAVWVEDVRSRHGAAWNARARFPAASTVKLGIAVEALRAPGGPPPAGSDLDLLLRRMLVESDNEAANALLVRLGGSSSGGAARVNATLDALGIRESYLYGGYALTTSAARPIPLRVEEQPAWGAGKFTTAADLARLHRVLSLAAAGQGPALLLPGSFTRADARFLLWVLARVDDHGKLDRYLPGRARTLHKAGWIANARHDAGLVLWRGGAYVAVVMTWNPRGAGLSSDVLAGWVAASALRRFERLAEPARTTARTSRVPVPGTWTCTHRLAHGSEGGFPATGPERPRPLQPWPGARHLDRSDEDARPPTSSCPFA